MPFPVQNRLCQPSSFQSRVPRTHLRRHSTLGTLPPTVSYGHRPRHHRPYFFHRAQIRPSEFPFSEWSMVSVFPASLVFLLFPPARASSADAVLPLFPLAWGSAEGSVFVPFPPPMAG